MRQKAVATGPISLRRTKIGDKAMPSAPMRRAIRAIRALRSDAAVSLWIGCEVVGEGVEGIARLLRGAVLVNTPSWTPDRAVWQVPAGVTGATASIPSYGAF